MNIGVIGNGFVGNSIYHTFCLSNTVRVFDINDERATHSLIETVDESDIIFVCVPTPMMEGGKTDLSYIRDAFNLIRDTAHELDMDDDDLRSKTFVIKSTVVPNTTRELNAEFDELNIIFSPEFLTERTAVSDSICANHILIGSDEDMGNSAQELYNLYKDRFGSAYNIVVTDSVTSEFIKYMRNTFFATKVTFMNEMFRIAANMGVDWEDAVSGFVLDGRIGHSHLSVPGHDGMYGFGGTCFPKDINALIVHSKKTGFTPPLLSSVRDANLKYRGVEDWKESKGRAVFE